MTTGFTPVVPFASPVTCVLEPEGPVITRFTVGCSPAAPPDHDLFTVTEPVWRVFVTVQRTSSPLAIAIPVCGS